MFSFHLKFFDVGLGINFLCDISEGSEDCGGDCVPDIFVIFSARSTIDVSDGPA